MLQQKAPQIRTFSESKVRKFNNTVSLATLAGMVMIHSILHFMFSGSQANSLLKAQTLAQELLKVPISY